MFSSLTVQVTEDELRFYFGPGFWEQSILVDHIQSTEIVQNPLYYGWGIRYTFPGWLYNVSGQRAVELEIEGEGPFESAPTSPRH